MALQRALAVAALRISGRGLDGPGSRDGEGLTARAES